MPPEVKRIDVRRFDAAKMQKLNLFETPRFFCDVYCLLPGQGQKPHAHAAAESDGEGGRISTGRHDAVVGDLRVPDRRRVVREEAELVDETPAGESGLVGVVDERARVLDGVVADHAVLDVEYPGAADAPRARAARVAPP